MAGVQEVQSQEGSHDPTTQRQTGQTGGTGEEGYTGKHSF